MSKIFICPLCGAVTEPTKHHYLSDRDKKDMIKICWECHIRAHQFFNKERIPNKNGNWGKLDFLKKSKKGKEMEFDYLGWCYEQKVWKDLRGL